MAAKDLVALIHLVGFVTGVALYAMLAVMTWRSRARAESPPSAGGSIPVLAAVLGIVWNASALLVFGWHDFGLGELSPWLTTLAYSALGFLPAVVVDSATRPAGPHDGLSRFALFAYTLSAAAAVMQVTSTADTGEVSSIGLLTLTLGYAAIVLVLVMMSWRRTRSYRAVTAVALAVFAVSALHLSHHTAGSDSWFVELLGHHASLALVLVILYQDYRFALADLFIKRALAGIALVAIVVATYALLWTPWGPAGRRILPAGEPVVLLVAWIATAFLYPRLRTAVDRLVDRVILRRADYREVRAEIATELATAESPDDALDVACARLRKALTASRASWRKADTGEPIGRAGHIERLDGGAGVQVTVPTAEPPGYVINIRELSNGRRLLSDDLVLLDGVAIVVARRVDELRVTRERLDRDIREHEMQRLAAEAELRALRAQLNPHFLFNALTTIGYLIRTSPPRAIETLMQLTSLLRAVLRRATGEFVTLGEEMQIVDAYLAIERVRFEERLRIERRVPEALTGVAIPPLILQPIVENAIKHGISPRRQGGVVRIEARLVEPVGGDALLQVQVADTGAGVSDDELALRRKAGLGLTSVARRLAQYYGDRGRVDVRSVPGCGTIVDVYLPIGTMPASGRAAPLAESVAT